MILKPSMSAGIVMVHDDGIAFDVVPFQVFQLSSGATIIRIGRNALWFDPDGAFDGTEHRLPAGVDPVVQKMLVASLEMAQKNRGKPPEESYFRPGAPGHASETASWPEKKVVH